MKKFKDFIVDLDGMHLVNTNNGLLYKFNFTDMIMTKITKQSKANFPIRYDNNTQSILIWHQRRWQERADGIEMEAIIYMFNHSVEQQLLGE